MYTYNFTLANLDPHEMKSWVREGRACLGRGPQHHVRSGTAEHCSGFRRPVEFQ